MTDNNNLKDFIKEYLQIYNIPLKNLKGNSTVDMIVDGRSSANWTSRTVLNWIEKYFPNKPKNQMIYTYILNQFDLRYCFNCHEILESYDFYKGQSKCKNCSKNIAHNWHNKNKDKGIISSANYRASKIQRTPKWANLQKIKDFYLNCPKNYHVDHVIPLQGKNISGLHVIENLQYLTAEENYKKGNKW